MITHTLAGWRDAVSTRLITNEDDTRGPLFWGANVLGSSDRMHDLRPILFSRLWADRGGIRLIFLETGTYLINAGVLSEKKKKWPVPGLRTVESDAKWRSEKMRRRGRVFVPLATLFTIPPILKAWN